MGDRANVVVVRADGAHELYRSGWAVGLDLDLLDGPAALLDLLPGLHRDGWWLDEVMADGGVLVDLGRRVLLFFVREGPSGELRHHAALLELVRAAWPGWEVRRLYDGPAELRAHLGLDAEYVRCPDAPLCPAPFLAPDDEDLAGPDPGGVLVTVAGGGCHVASHCFDHPVHEGPALLDRLADAPGHDTGRLHVNAGLHLDPARRRLGWWTLCFSPGAYRAPESWPGWTVEFWQDDWRRHAAADPRCAPAPFDAGATALTAVRTEAAERRAAREEHRALVEKLRAARAAR
ncbi:hypothetical protein [Kitasatospora sp. NPDC088134]|uniref:hypothetical protein n=1 Tax=Kitasatospora sp. NPDC088134 TaxID=3364071 RepID=UPI0038261400